MHGKHLICLADLADLTWSEYPLNDDDDLIYINGKNKNATAQKNSKPHQNLNRVLHKINELKILQT